MFETVTKPKKFLKSTNTWLLYIIPCLYFFMPKPPTLPNFHYLGYLIIVLFILVILLLDLHHSTNFILKDIVCFFKVNRIYLYSIIMLAFFISVIFIHTFFCGLNFSTLIFFGKFIFFSLIFLYSYRINSFFREETKLEILARFSYLFLIIQTAIALVQLVNPDFFHMLYNSHKTYGLGGLVRITGTLVNPNVFAWAISINATIIIVMKGQLQEKIVAILLSFALVFFSGSRTHLFMFIGEITLVLLLYLVSKSKHKLVTVISVLVFSVLSLVIILVALNQMRDKFPYITQILKVFETGDLSSVNSMKLRFAIWDNYMSEMSTRRKWIFGLPPFNTEFADNDYLYTILRSGILGFVSIVIFYCSKLIIVFRKPKNNMFFVSIVYLVFSLIVGLVSETLSGWVYPIILMVLLPYSIVNQREIVNAL